ncbi:MAG: flagellar basal-body MS-ring/collar protein FliF [Methyloligellaceae bacterium]
MNNITEFLKVLGPTRLAAMGAVAVTLIGFFAFVMLQMSKQQMSILFTNLPIKDSIAIVKKLDAMNVTYEMKQNGSILLVPKDQVLQLRMKLAEDGLPIGGGSGYEIFDKGDNLGATSFVQNINHRRAIEGELARTIRSLDRVETARVHLVLPKKKLFSREQPEPSASIIVRVTGSLETGQIKAIQHLTAAAIEGLKPSRVSIVDEKGRLLASGGGNEGGGIISGVIEERNLAFENRLQREITNMVSSVVGAGRVRVRVTAELDYTKKTRVSETFNPDGQVVRSTKSSSQASSASQPSSNNGVTVGNELPSANANNNNNGAQQEQLKKSEEVVNYEISKTNQTEVVEAGRVKRIAVAVLVDGIYTKSSKGQPNYSPRPQGELTEIEELVKSAISFDADRGDKVHVANLRFADSGLDNIEEEPPLLDLSKDDYFTIGEIAVTLLLALLVVLMVIRPLVRRIVTPEETIELLEQEVIDEQLAEIEKRKAEILEGTDGDIMLDADGNPIPIEPKSGAVELLKSAKLNGEIQASFIKEVGTLVLNNPQEAVTIIRTWIDKGDDRADEDKANDKAA